MKEIKWLFEVSKELKTGIVAYCYDFIDKLQLIDFSAKLMESGYYEDDIEILAGGECSGQVKLLQYVIVN